MIRWASRIALLLALLFLGNRVFTSVADWFGMTLVPESGDLMYGAILLALAAYVLLTAIPFVPGVEIGLTMMMALGGAYAPVVYLATAVSLTLAYLVGRLIPPATLSRGLLAIGLKRAAAFVTETAGMSDQELRERLLSASTSRVAQGILRYRYVALALAINAPGNVVLGGGGGLAMMAGLSRLFAPLPFFLTVLVAILPVPLLFFLGHR